MIKKSSTDKLDSSQSGPSSTELRSAAAVSDPNTLIESLPYESVTQYSTPIASK